jgi:hypothetical protein
MNNTFKFSALLMAILMNCSIAFAQIKFEKIYGGDGYDYAYSVIQMYDNGYAVAGATSSHGLGGTDAYVMKTDSLGIVKWYKTFGGINIDRFYSINTTADSGLIVAGYTNSFGAGGYDLLLVKLDKLGNQQWQKTYGGSNWEFAYSAQQTVDGGYIVSGGTYSFGAGDEDFYLVKTDALGDTVWTKAFGLNNEEEAKSVKQTSDGGYVMTGHTKSFGDLTGDVYTVKTDGNGDTLWTNVYQGLQSDLGYDILESYTGQFIIAGKSKSVGLGNYDGILLKLSATGANDILGSYCGTTDGGTDDDGFHSICETAAGRFAILGYTYSFGFGQGTNDFTMYVTNPVNGFHYGSFGGTGSETGHCIRNTKDGGYIICGNSTSYSTLDHVYLIKTDSNGVSSANVISIDTGIKDSYANNSKINTYPTPASEYLTVDLSQLDANKLTVTIFNLLGEEVYHHEINNPSERKETINVSNLTNGVYFITVYSETETYSKKIIVSH